MIKFVGCKETTRASELLDGSSEYIITYQDKDGDWMLVGDVPWLYDILLSLPIRLVYLICFLMFFFRFFLSQDVPWVREKTENHEKIR